MVNKNVIIGVIVVILLLLAAGVGYYFYQQPKNNPNPPNTTNTPIANVVEGSVMFGIKDAASPMVSISSIIVTLSNAQLHGKEGWVNVGNSAKQFDLLALNQSGNIALFSKANVKTGTYDQMKLTVDKIIVVENGVQNEAKIPSGILNILGNMTVNEKTTATVIFDFMADESLHKTGSGKFIFTPVVRVEARSDANVDTSDNNNVIITNGQVQTDVAMGMDVNGVLKPNFMVDSKAKLDIIGNTIQVIP